MVALKSCFSLTAIVIYPHRRDGYSLVSFLRQPLFSFRGIKLPQIGIHVPHLHHRGTSVKLISRRSKNSQRALKIEDCVEKGQSSHFLNKKQPFSGLPIITKESFLQIVLIQTLSIRNTTRYSSYLN